MVRQFIEPASVKSAERVLDIFELLRSHAEGLTFSQLCQALALPKSSAHALLRVLEQRGYLEQHPESRSYRIGLRLYEAGNAYRPATDLREAAAAALDAVRDLCGEAVNLGVLSGRDAVWIDTREAQHRSRVHTFVGMRMGAHRCALGKALLASSVDAELERILAPSQPGFGPSPTTSELPRLKQELAKVRRTGVSHNFGEGMEGVHGVGAPIRNYLGSVVASLSISVPEGRMTPAYRARLARLITAAAAIISSRLGYQPDTFVPMTVDDLHTIWETASASRPSGGHPRRVRQVVTSVHPSDRSSGAQHQNNEEHAE
jgi:IclR family transcriptional regulator, KDG regulon repressor